MTVAWAPRLLEQLTTHWDQQLRPAFGELTDDDYLWEPVAGCWSIRPRGEATTRMAAGSGDYVIDWEFPEPDPPPVTTIAWRMAHLIVGIFGARNASHFAGPPADYQSWTYAPDAKGALAQLDAGYARWVAGASGLDNDALEQPIGEQEGEWAEFPYAALLLHINRETMHHGAEILLLRDMRRAQR